MATDQKAVKLYLPHSLDKRLRQSVAKSRRSIAAEIRLAIEERLEREETKA